MTYTYTLLVLDENGLDVVTHDLTPDHAVMILAQALTARPQQTTARETHAKAKTSAPSKKKGRKKRETGGESAAPKRATRFTPKPCCGSTGPRHKKDCPNFQKSPTKDASRALNAEIRDFHAEAAKPEPLTLAEYADLRDAMHEPDFQSAEYALTNRLPPREVNSAVRSSSYEDYMVIR